MSVTLHLNCIIYTTPESNFSDEPKKLAQLLKEDPALKQRVETLDAIEGVGDRTAFLILAQIPELGQMNRQQAAALAGLAPWTRESGAMKRTRHIGGGRPEVRRVLYMPALSATRFNPILREFHNRRTAKGKCFKVALTAVIRKLLT